MLRTSQHAAMLISTAPPSCTARTSRSTCDRAARAHGRSRSFSADARDVLGSPNALNLAVNQVKFRSGKIMI
jgi:hypothetical protein